MTRVTRAPGAPPETVTLNGEVTVSRLGVGTIRLTEQRGFGPARANAVQLLRRAVDLGINFIDTADSYGPGTAETVVRDALHPYHGLTIATKGGFEHPTVDEWKENGHPDHLKAALEGSLTRLRLEQIPLYYLHVPDPNVPYAESLGAIKDLQAEGKIRFVGISNVTSAHVHVAREVLGDSLVSVQNYYNVMFHHGASKYCEDTENVLDECDLREWAFVAWEPLGTGAELPGVDDDEMFRSVMAIALESEYEQMVSVGRPTGFDFTVRNIGTADIPNLAILFDEGDRFLNYYTVLTSGSCTVNRNLPGLACGPLNKGGELKFNMVAQPRKAGKFTFKFHISSGGRYLEEDGTAYTYSWAQTIFD